MAKKRPPTWSRGTARPAPEPQPTKSGPSGTADVDFGDSRTVDPTWDPSSDRGAAFEPIAEPAPRPSRWMPAITGSGVSAVVAVIGLFGLAYAYVAAIKTDVAVIGSKVEGLQKSYDGAVANLREDIRRVENGFEARVNRLLDLVQGRRESEASKKRPSKR